MSQSKATTVPEVVVWNRQFHQTKANHLKQIEG